MRKRRLWMFGVGAVALVVLGVFLWAAWSPTTSEEDLGDDEQGPSVDLAADLKLVWQTQPLRGTPDPSHGENPRASTPEAIAAASRVFKAVNPIGLTREEAVAKLGDPRTSNDSVYNFPFYPVRRGVMVYRFDAGNGGWQFNVYFDAQGKVRKVQRLGIE
jgi:hypothetical protein